jgi:hypothetical protein
MTYWLLFLGCLLIICTLALIPPPRYPDPHPRCPADHFPRQIQCLNSRRPCVGVFLAELACATTCQAAATPIISYHEIAFKTYLGGAAA